MIKLGVLTDFSPDELSQLQEACDMVNAAIVDPVFLEMLRSATFDNTTDSNDTVIAKLSQDVTVSRLYCEYLGWVATHLYRTVAKEDPKTGIITFNRAYYDGQSVESKANTLFHEVWHVLGYSHFSSKDYLSWPYQAGDLIQKYLVQKGANS